MRIRARSVVRVALTVIIYAVELNARGDSGAKSVDALRDDASKAAQRAVAWLGMQQNRDGQFGAKSPPAATALLLIALREMPGVDAAMLGQAERFVRKYVEEPGSTADAGVADRAVCRGVLGLQGGSGRNGMGTDGDWAYAQAVRDRDESARSREFDLRQSVWQQERRVLEERGVNPEHFMAEQLAYAAVPSASPDGNDRTVAELRERFPLRRLERGYGRITYSGLLALLSDTVTDKDPRVDALVNWAEQAWSLDVTPRGGKAGLFFFYHVTAKCLDAARVASIQPVSGAVPIQWRAEMVRKLLSLQRVSDDGSGGYWVNSDGSYLEGDAVLVTAYALLALHYALGTGEQASGGAFNGPQ